MRVSHFAVRVAGDFDGDLAVGQLGNRLTDQADGLEQFLAPDGAAGVGIAFGSGDGLKVEFAVGGVAELAHVLGDAAGAQCRADAAQLVSLLAGEHAHTAEAGFDRAVVRGTPG